VDSSGAQADDVSYDCSISGDGRFVAFLSLASNLVPGDTNRKQDAFVHDRNTGTTTRVSVSSAGVQAEWDTLYSSISADGCFIAFSTSSKLVSDDTTPWDDVFVHDLETRTTTLASVNSSGEQGYGGSDEPSISEDGRFVTFKSGAANLVPGDTNAREDVFLRDRESGTTTRGSVSSSGAEGDDWSYRPAISAAGRFVAFQSFATNLVPLDTNGFVDTFVHGPSLTLEASPDIVTAGTAMTLTTFTGRAGGPALLAVVEVNGTPVFQPITLAIFDAIGLWTLPVSVPPGLSGNAVTLVTAGIAPAGSVEVSNLEQVIIQ